MVGALRFGAPVDGSADGSPEPVHLYTIDVCLGVMTTQGIDEGSVPDVVCHHGQQRGDEQDGALVRVQNVSGHCGLL